jgi:hypothetical protein
VTKRRVSAVAGGRDSILTGSYSGDVRIWTGTLRCCVERAWCDEQLWRDAFDGLKQNTGVSWSRLERGIWLAGAGEPAGSFAAHKQCVTAVTALRGGANEAQRLALTAGGPLARSHAIYRMQQHQGRDAAPDPTSC